MIFAILEDKKGFIKMMENVDLHHEIKVASIQKTERLMGKVYPVNDPTGERITFRFKGWIDELRMIALYEEI